MSNLNRTCGECTKCCEGYLHSENELQVGDKVFKLGNTLCPILKIGKGCGDYENRPQNPCRGFECEWLRHPDVYPEEMRPDKNLVIFSQQEVDGVRYLRLTEAGARLDAEALSFGIKLTLQSRGNIYWEVEGKMHWLGNRNFIQIMNKHKEENLLSEPKSERTTNE
jgi:hypothetical protein